MTDSEQEPEQRLEELQDQTDSLGEDIEAAKKDWESKKADPAVPGAGGDPQAADSDHAEDQFPGVGGSDSAPEDLEDAER